jgi:TetR/AcrR family transcriptional repressor of lmrAB and yxaGH operons
MRDSTSLSSRDRMIEAAIDLMRAYGLSGAGINDVVQRSGAPRGSLYHHFPGGKLQMACEALGVHGARVQSFMEQALASEASGPAKVVALFEAFARRVEQAGFRRSCPFGCVALDLDDDTEPLREIVAHSFEDWKDGIASHFPALGPQASREFAGLLLTGIEGAYVRARAEHSGDGFREAGRWMARLATGMARPRAESTRPASR